MATQFSDPSRNVNASPFTPAAAAPGREGVSGAQVDTRSRVWQQKAVDVDATRKLMLSALPEVERVFGIICGTPTTVIPKLRVVMEVLRPGALILWQNDGPIEGKHRVNNLKLIGSEVMPALREFGNELGLTSAFEVKPGSRPLPSSGKPESVGSVEPLQAWRRQSGQ